MFLRFETNRPAPRPGEPAALQRAHGLFQGVDYDMLRARAPVWLQREIDREIAWFEAALPKPSRLQAVERRGRRRRAAPGYCWFRPEAAEAIRRARHLAWALEESGQPVTEIRSADPGEILWADALQIVAAPTLRHARGFRGGGDALAAGRRASD